MSLDNDSFTRFGTGRSISLPPLLPPPSTQLFLLQLLSLGIYLPLKNHFQKCFKSSHANNGCEMPASLGTSLGPGHEWWIRRKKCSPQGTCCLCLALMFFPVIAREHWPMTCFFQFSAFTQRIGFQGWCPCLCSVSCLPVMYQWAIAHLKHLEHCLARGEHYLYMLVLAVSGTQA